LQLERTARFLQDACIYAEGSCVDIASENSLGVRDNLEMIHRVDHPKFYILLDLYNPVRWGHSVKEIAGALKQHLATQIHAKDGCDGQMGNVTLGAGDGDFHRTASFLASCGFDGTVILENNYKSEAERAVELDLSILRRYFSFLD
jgi:L-ribulose-5-phosphate 3-epimerase